MSEQAGLAQVAMKVSAALAARNLSFALVGGLAVSAHAETRFTRDVDLAVAVETDDEATELIFSLQSEGYRTLQTVEHEAQHRLATVSMTLGSGAAPLVTDLLFAMSGIEAEVVRDAERIEVLPGVIIPVASSSHLIALKVLSRDDTERPQDRMDLIALLREATDADIDSARSALGLITSRAIEPRI